MLSETLTLIAEQIRSHRQAIKTWQTSYRVRVQPPFYCSLDIRDSGYKIVPVDSNLFPAGFNNICPQDLETAPSVLRSHVEALAADTKPIHKILILPESHTQNKFYIENLRYLKNMVEGAGYEVKIGWYGRLPEGQSESFSLESESGHKLPYSAISIDNGIMSAGGFIPDLILVNNDFSSGYPKGFDSLSQLVVPSPKLGWHSRKKSRHFHFYNQLASEFASLINIDSWLIQVDTEEVSPIDFQHNIGIDRLCECVDRVLARTKVSYLKHNIQREPFVFIKHNAGTYGMGIMTVSSSDEIRTMNRRTKNKMSVGKNNLLIDSVCVQEGVPTIISSEDTVAEPVIYLVGWELVGGFLRSNTKKGDGDNLNSQGMVLKKLCLSDLRYAISDDQNTNAGAESSRELVYGAISQISTLATGLELEEIK